MPNVFCRMVVVLVALLTTSIANASNISYTIIPLPLSLEPLVVNNNGAIAGEMIYGPSQGFVAQQGGPVMILNLPGVTSVVVSGINSSSEVVGYGECSGGTCGFTYTDGTGQTLNQGLGLAARSINDSGTVAGNYSTGTSNQAFTYSNGQFQNLGTLPSGINSVAYGISNSGQVIGGADSGGAQRAFLYSNGSMQDLGTLPGDPFAYAYSINNLGQVTGLSYGGSNGLQAFIYTPGVGMTALGDLPGQNSAGFQRPESINDDGQIVGSDSLDSGDYAFLYSNGTIYNLNDLVTNGNGWSLQTAYGINDNGEIVGYGTYDGVAEGFILSQTYIPPPYIPVPAPEPKSLVACLVAALLIAGVKCRRQQVHTRNEVREPRPLENP